MPPFSMCEGLEATYWSLGELLACWYVGRGCEMSTCEIRMIPGSGEDYGFLTTAFPVYVSVPVEESIPPEVAIPE